MARCCGGATCSCAVEAGDGILVTGVGSSASPYVVSFDPDVLLDYQPGLEIGHAEILAPVSTTATAAGTYIVPGLSMILEGTGRPVDVEMFFPQIYHSVADTQVYAAFIANGVVSTIRTQVAATVSPSTARGPSVYGRRRMILDDGVSYTFTVSVWGQAAGTTSVFAATFENAYLSAVNR